MKFKKTYHKSGVLSAVLIGSLTGFIGFAIFISLIVVGDQKKDQTVETNTSPIAENTEVDKKTFYALQYGVFSSKEAAAAFMKDFSSLNLAATVAINEKYYIWSKLSPTKGDITQTIPSSFWKQLTITNVCPDYPELLNILESVTENNFLNIEEISGKIPSGLTETLTSIHQLSNDPNIWRAHLVAIETDQKSCLKLDFQ